MSKSRAAAKTPYTHQPPEMSLEEWQIALRREYGLAQKLKWTNLGDDPVFSEFAVANPVSQKTYRVAIRGTALGHNYCSCPDFSINTLGTCKHIEFVLNKLMKKRETKSRLRAGYHPPFAEIYLRYGSQRQVVFQSSSQGGADLKDRAGHYFDENNILRPESYRRIDDFVAEARNRGETIYFYEDARQFIQQAIERQDLQEKIRQTFPEGVRDRAWDGLLKTDLFPYQRAGALFAASAGRSLLADEMGLGKTIQTIAAVEILARVAGIRRALVIAPSSLRHQWQQEIQKFTDRSAQIIQGMFKRRVAGYNTDTFFKITNYDVISTDGDLIAGWAPDVIVLDEAQRIKNWRTKTAKSVKQLRSKYAVVLTGTPLENRLEELHSIVQFVDFFHLGPLFRFLNTHQQVDEKGRVIGYRHLNSISKSLEAILLRRSKAEVLPQLPGRLEKKIFIQMTSAQWRHHQANQQTVAGLVAKWRRFRFLSEEDKKILMCALQEMRMVCNSTYLLDPRTDVGNKIPEAAALAEEILERAGEKIIIFSQWLASHELLVRRFEKRRIGHCFFHGGLSAAERQKMVRRFREDPQCQVFLSTDAGGVGLNLQHASVVIHLDQPWNPAVLEQRTGRAHRLGQHKTVRVIHFIAEGAIEHRIQAVLQFKQDLFKGIMEKGKDEVFFGGTRFDQFMASVEKITTPEMGGGREMALVVCDTGDIARDKLPLFGSVEPGVPARTLKKFWPKAPITPDPAENNPGGKELPKVFGLFYLPRAFSNFFKFIKSLTRLGAQEG
jgi:SNF2 family DNA or RNA helicase